MTIAIQLEAQGLDMLQAEATELGVTPEQLANDIVQRHLRTRTDVANKVANDSTFRAALSASITENSELLRRLAK